MIQRQRVKNEENDQRISVSGDSGSYDVFDIRTVSPGLQIDKIVLAGP